MSQRQRKKKTQKASRPHGAKRLDLIVEIVKTDSTFELTEVRNSGQVWVGRCIHCNCKLVVAQTGETAATLEHIVPISGKGSPDDIHNLALACAGCNNNKGIKHDQYAGRGGRADEVIAMLLAKREARWRNAPDVT